MEWPSDKVERTSIKSITPYARNSRTHSDEQVAQIAASIKEWGFTTPILIDTDGEIIAGHGRLLAAQRAWTRRSTDYDSQRMGRKHRNEPTSSQITSSPSTQGGTMRCSK